MKFQNVSNANKHILIYFFIAVILSKSLKKSSSGINKNEWADNNIKTDEITVESESQLSTNSEDEVDSEQENNNHVNKNKQEKRKQNANNESEEEFFLSSEGSKTTGNKSQKKNKEKRVTDIIQDVLENDINANKKPEAAKKDKKAPSFDSDVNAKKKIKHPKHDDHTKKTNQETVESESERDYNDEENKFDHEKYTTSMFNRNAKDLEWYKEIYSQKWDDDVKKKKSGDQITTKNKEHALKKKVKKTARKYFQEMGGKKPTINRKKMKKRNFDSSNANDDFGNIFLSDDYL